MERHFQTAIQIVLLGVAAWIGNSVVALRDSNAMLVTKVATLEQRINEINNRFDQYLPRTEAQLRAAAEDEKHRDFDRRLDTLERSRSTR